jgi:hypothetical protein
MTTVNASTQNCVYPQPVTRQQLPTAWMKLETIARHIKGLFSLVCVIDAQCNQSWNFMFSLCKIVLGNKPVEQLYEFSSLKH